MAAKGQGDARKIIDGSTTPIITTQTTKSKINLLITSIMTTLHGNHRRMDINKKTALTGTGNTTMRYYGRRINKQYHTTIYPVIFVILALRLLIVLAWQYGTILYDTNRCYRRIFPSKNNYCTYIHIKISYNWHLIVVIVLCWYIVHSIIALFCKIPSQ